jgi:hypothetical protein
MKNTVLSLSAIFGFGIVINFGIVNGFGIGFGIGFGRKFVQFHDWDIQTC